MIVTEKEQLEQEACDNGITVDYVDFKWMAPSR